MATPFDYDAWAVRFPELVARAPEATVIAIAPEADLVLDLSRAPDDGTRTALQQLVVAHLVSLAYPLAGSAAASGVVGRVSGASEGSTSVSFDLPAAPTLLSAWWAQTSYGTLLWALTASWRLFRYIPGYPRRHPLLNPLP